MSVRKAPHPSHPDKPWLAETYANGRQRRRFKTRRAAIDWEREASKRRAPSRGLEEALAEYLEHEVQNLRKPRDPISHARALRPYIRGRSFEEMSQVVEDIKRDRGQLSVATVNRRLALLRRLGTCAEQWGWLERAPRVRLLPGEARRETFLDRKQVEQLARGMPRGGDIVRLAAYTGLRRRELLTLTQDNIQHGRIVVETLKQKRRTLRTVPVPERVRHILKDIPFAITPQVLRMEWETARKKLKLDHVRFHDLRHTYASWLAEAGVSDRVMGELLGHSSAEMVRRYAHLRPEHLDKVARKL